MDTFSGLPAHPLVAHAPVILIPLAALAAVVAALRPATRRILVPTVIGFAGVGLITVMLAMSSGEFLTEKLELEVAIAKHEELAESSRLLIAAFLAAAVGAWWVRRADTATLARWQTPTMWLVALLGVLATIWIARTGHEGASVVWNGWDGQG